MLETDFRLLFLEVYGASNDFTLCAPNPGGTTTRDRSGRVTGHFRSGVPKGTLDLLGFTHGDGLHIEMELKNASTPTSPEQKTRMGRLRAMGCVVAFYRIDQALSIRENLTKAHDALMAAILERRA